MSITVREIRRKCDRCAVQADETTDLTGWVMISQILPVRRSYSDAVDLCPACAEQEDMGRFFRMLAK